MRRSSIKLSSDANKRAYEIVRLSTEESQEETSIKKDKPKKERSPISEYLAEIGRKGGLKGGKVRAERLSPEQRKEIARQAALTRWKNSK